MRPLYDYDKIYAFQHLHYDVKHITDKHALPVKIYNLFKNKKDLPIYQWTIIDAKTRMRFLAYSCELSSFFGQRFLLYVIFWLRAHSIHDRINVMFDGGVEFCSANEEKLREWQKFFSAYGVHVDHTRGDKRLQNLVERSHRSDDEEFYCPRGLNMNTKQNFLIEAQKWNIYWNCDRFHSGIDGMTPVEKLESLGVVNAWKIGTFPTFILEDIFDDLLTLPICDSCACNELYQNKKSYYVLTYYRIHTILTGKRDFV
jgi:hypothetical protein